MIWIFALFCLLIFGHGYFLASAKNLFNFSIFIDTDSKSNTGKANLVGPCYVQNIFKPQYTVFGAVCLHFKDRYYYVLIPIYIFSIQFKNFSIRKTVSLPIVKPILVS